jgi:hypothetical protein
VTPADQCLSGVNNPGYNSHNMFPLFSERFPANADELRQMLEQSLRQFVDTDNDIVSVREKTFPELCELRLNLDGARLQSSAPRPSGVSGETTPAFRVEHFELSASGISVEEAPIDLLVHATNLQLHQGCGRDGKVVLVIKEADTGQIDLSATKPDLEKLILTIVKREATKQGVAIEDLKLSLNSGGPRAIEGIIQLRARKSFFRGVIRVAARLEVDEKLVATLSNLSCTGEGTVGAMASNLLRQQLQRLDGHQLNLAALPLGEIALRDIEITIGEKLGITAQFGRAS